MKATAEIQLELERTAQRIKILKDTISVVEDELRKIAQYRALLQEA